MSSFEQACLAADEKKAAERKKAKANGGTKPVLLIDQGELPTVAEKLRDLLATSGMLFDRGVPVRIATPPDGGLPAAIPLTNHGVVRMAHQHCRPQQNGENATLSDRVAGLYLDMVGDWNLPKLVGITSSPLLTDDGDIRAAVGYDRHARLYCCNIPELILPDKPTEEQARKALEVLRSTFRTFPFADSSRRFDPILGVDVVDLTAPIGMDESGFLVGLLTAVCRQSLWLAPGFLLNAPQISGAGSGKGLLARAISAIAYGICPRPFTMGNDRHEMDKRIVAEVMEGSPVLFMDNINATLLRSNTLASLTTERPSGVRELGKSRMIKLEHASFIVLTGNGLAVSEDLARRFIFCELDPQCEDPEQRPFKPGFPQEIEQRRAELLTAALTIWRWGRLTPQKSGITLGSFETWGQWVRDPLLALDCRDPVEQIKEIKTKDPARQKVAELFELWWEHHKDAPTRVNDFHEDVKAVLDPQGRGRQFLARGVQDLTNTRQAGYVLTREKGAGRKSLATYQLKEAPKGGNGGRHPPHTPHAPGDTEISTESTSPGGDAQGMPPGSYGASPHGHTQGIPKDDATKHRANSTARDGAEGMRGMGGMPPGLLARAIPGPVDRRGCDYCGETADSEPLQIVTDGTRSARLHRRCEASWLDGVPGPKRTVLYGSDGGFAHVIIKSIKAQLSGNDQ